MREITAYFTSGFPTEEMKTELVARGYKLLYGNEKKTSGQDLSDVEVLVCFNPFPYLSLKQMPNLKWIHLVSKGINHVPQKEITERGILVTNTLQSTSIPISEWIITQILCLYKQIPFFVRNHRKKAYCQCDNILELTDKKILFLGTGFIAREAAVRLRAFGTHIDGFNTTGHPVGNMFDSCYPIAQLRSRIKEYDIVISTLPATESTYHLLDGETLSLLPSHAIVVNVSRGSIIDTPSLVKLLKDGKLRGAALDVFEQEPLPADSPLWELENVLITPHNSYLSEYYQNRNLKEAFENLILYSENKPLNNPADFQKGY